MEDDLIAQARASLALFCFGEISEYALVSQQVHTSSGRPKFTLDERVLKTKGSDTTLYIVRAFAHLPSAIVDDVRPILLDSSDANTHHTMQFLFGGKAHECIDELLDETDLSTLRMKRAVVDQAGMLKTRWQSTFLDFTTTVTPDWLPVRGGATPTDMHVRVVQSCPDLLDLKEKAIAPRGIMVRESMDGGVDVQFAVSFVEAGLMNLPRRNRYQRLAMGISKLDETVVSRRVTRSLRTNTMATTWVRDDSRQTCHICVTKFRVNKRRHHCRLCGEVACDSCAPKVDLMLPSANEATAVRICMVCIHKEPEMATSMHPVRRRRTSSTVEAISDAMYFKKPMVDACGGSSTANSSVGGDDDLSDSEDASSSVSADSSVVSNPPLLDLTLHFESCLPSKFEDTCACCRDKLGAIRYECSRCEDTVCGPCNIQKHRDNLCRTCVVQEKQKLAVAPPPLKTMVKAVSSVDATRIVRQAAYMWAMKP
ncbi:Aste57867_14966 [Aphanomyces stellatus]|uniref:Aste57867_14966 protein n=1 Tax=Aphanomyces stellatus TaxID=120398 RepID=A0A485L215_9STRA|nr:hypothetical protein As57867_014910 [Aphanomyces stellatus]VFT91780.1 Aste57867_14966 [Aphanomyces stellatus]